MKIAYVLGFVGVASFAACVFQTGGIPAQTGGAAPTGGSTGAITQTGTGTGGLHFTTSSGATGAGTTTSQASSGSSATGSSGTSSSSAASSSSGALADGQTCMVGTQCASGQCYMGTKKVCCNNPCSGCESCLMSETGQPDGICAPVKGNSDPNHACMTVGGMCNGAGQCQCNTPGCGMGCTNHCGLGTPCNVNGDCTSNACQQGVCCNSMCDPTMCFACNQGPFWVGQCTPVPVGTSCGGGKVCTDCNTAGECKTMSGTVNGGTCTLNTDCVSGACSGGKCVIGQQPGMCPCVDSSQCDMANGCVNHFCL